MKRYRTSIILGVIVLAVLAAAFWWGGSAPGLRGRSTDAPAAVGRMHLPKTETSRAEETSQAQEAAKDGDAEQPPSDGSAEAEQTAPVQRNPEPNAAAVGQDAYRTEPVPEDKPAPVEPQYAEVTDTAHTCTLTVRCDTILDHLDWLKPEKAELVPSDGVILPEQSVTFYEGESVFHLLVREMKRHKIHLEFTNTPIYNSAYIEGIQNLYEFDCGELSGWVYKVNGWAPNYGCSRYQLQEGDRVEWLYSCDLGADVGGKVIQ